MMIRGNTVGTTALRPDWNQTDANRSDYIRGKESVETAVQTAMAQVQQQTAQHMADGNNPHGVTLQQLGAAARDHSHTAAEVGAVTEEQVLQILQNQLGVIENGTY